MMHAGLLKIDRGFARVLRACVLGLAVLSGASVVLMMLTTCSDIFLRALGHPLQGSYDIVSLLGALAISFALPYTTAVKGHVAVEYFFQRLPGRRLKIVVDSIIRLLVMVLFIVMAIANIGYGGRLAASGLVTPTLQLPVFWVPYMLALACAMVSLVVLYNLLHPGKAMIEP